MGEYNYENFIRWTWCNFYTICMGFRKGRSHCRILCGPGRSQDYGDYINLNIQDGRKNKKERKVNGRWSTTLREKIPDHRDYNLIFVSVKHTQLDSVVETITSKLNRASVLISNNFWGHQEDV